MENYKNNDLKNRVENLNPSEIKVWISPPGREKYQ